MKILESISIGNLELKNRMVMAPMTRSRANDEGVINDLAVVYYKQRATAGLIISEAINISVQGKGMPNTPGLYADEQIAAWKKITDAVHDAGGKIFAQLSHAGRVAHSMNRDGILPVAPSAVSIKGQKAHTSNGQMDYETPSELTVSEIESIIEDYMRAGANALKAGFDGVELHAALGYLPNQFLIESSNLRSDEYGGTIENRMRFIVEVLKGLIAIVGIDKVGVKLSPAIPINNMFDDNQKEVYSQLFLALNKLPLAYVHLMEALFPLEDFPHFPQKPLYETGHLINIPIITNGGYNRDSAEAVVQENKAQLVSFGGLFLANPDLPRRFELNASLNEPDRATMYVGGDEKGYTDYPTLNAI
ncbi:alkene reductase [Taibaiella soli]|uniref:Alkene reductase n=1 Tax=Taibaiella soli TaxID=1649169 RepID=A0A2W2AXJ0_9BACT|nr:alkene reductase [Taibaiella soli]PZF72714.1 alkene reductase [Taibaiella soli]